MPFRFPRPRYRPARAAAAVAVLAALAVPCGGCTSTDTTDVLDESSLASALILRPADFIGDVTCSDAPGAMRSYVATLIDHTDPDVPFTLPSSLPTPCSQGVRFDTIAPEHLYSVQIDGYEAFATEIGPTGWIDQDGDPDYEALRSGSRHMHAADGTAVSPRWLGSCAEGEHPYIVAASNGTTAIGGCDELVDTAPGSTETAVEVSPQDSLGVLSCAGDAPAGQAGVVSFDLAPQNGLPGLLGVPCTSPPFVQKYAGASLVPGAEIVFFVDARPTSNGEPLWGASCSAVVQEGLTVRASCSPLAEEGWIEIDVSDVLAELGAKCSGDVALYDAELLSDTFPLKKTGVPCLHDLSIGPLAPGQYTASIQFQAADGAPILGAGCLAEVEPGRAASVACTLK